MAVNELKYRGWHTNHRDATYPNGLLDVYVPTDSRQLHFASAADADTDWNIAQQTHPTIYVHSETTPITDYLALSHDGTSGFVNAVGGTLALQVSGTTVITVAAASVTHSQDVIISSGFGLNVGSATQVTISDGDGATNLIPEGQFLGVGTAFAGGAVVIATFNATNTRAVSPKLAFVKGAAATQVATTAVANDEVAGSIIAYVSDSADFETPIAAIEFVVDDVGAPGAGAAGGSLEFYTTADAGETLTLSFTINNDQNIYVANNNGVVVGHTAQVAVLAATPELQVLGTAAADSGLVLLRSSGDTSGPILYLAKARDAIGTFTTAITTGDVLGSIQAIGADTADLNANANAAAAIFFVSTGTIAADRIPGNISLRVATDAAPSVLTERVLITGNGQINFTPVTDTTFADGSGVIIGHTAQQALAGITSELQVAGTTNADGSVSIIQHVASGGSPLLLFGKSRTATLGDVTIIQSGDSLAEIAVCGADGVDFANVAAAILVVASGTIAENQTPGEIRLRTATNASPSVLTTRLTISNDGLHTIAAGTTPASVGTTPGTAHAGSITATGGLGGDTSIGTTGVGGIGAGFSFTGGAGGTANSATTSATGGNGGAFVVTTGAGAATAVAGVTGIGGNSGAITLLSGDGGAVSLAVSGTATGGRAGIVTVQGGVGGAVTATTGTNVGGIGGDVSIIAGAGGAASGATDTGGRGGILTLTPGAGGTGDANAAGAPGYISRTAGITRRQIQTIDMADAAVTLTLVPGTPVGTLMTSDILYVDANSGATENLLLPHEADLTGAILVIVNTGGETINIQNDAGGAVLTLETANTAIITCDGTTLRGVVGLP